jgi:lipoprotein-anchoring transpeptidase ErfK/SrfK
MIAFHRQADFIAAFGLCKATRDQTVEANRGWSEISERLDKVKNIQVSIRDQLLTLKEDATPIRTYPVSTSRFGIGTEQGSFKTPIGRFRVVEKIGGDQPAGTIFQRRVPVGPGDPLPPTEDLVMSRILWLDGLDDHNANTRERYIYIHGTKHESRIGNPDSYGCIRMRNADVVELFDLVDHDTLVTIEE